MNSIARQRGISIWIALVLIICIAFMGLIGLKLFPVYMESFKIDRALASLIENNELTTMSKNDIRIDLLRRLDIDSVTEVNDRNFWEVVTIHKDPDEVSIDVSYEVVAHIAANVSALVEFEKSVSGE